MKNAIWSVVALVLVGCGSVTTAPGDESDGGSNAGARVMVSSTAGAGGTSSAGASGDTGSTAGSAGANPAGVDGGTAGAVGTGMINFTVWTNEATNVATGVPTLKGGMRICVYNNDLYGALPMEQNSECATKYGLSLYDPIPRSLIVAEWASGDVTYDLNTNYRTQATAFTASIDVPVSTTGDYLVVIYQGSTQCGEMPPGGSAVGVVGGVPWDGGVFAGGRIGVPAAGTVVNVSKQMFTWMGANAWSGPGGLTGMWPHWSSCKL